MSFFGILLGLFALTFATSFDLKDEIKNRYEDVLDNLEDDDLEDNSDLRDENEENKKEVSESYEDNNPLPSYTMSVCSKVKARIARACEGNNLIINCNGKQKINVFDANYGRTSSQICSGRNPTKRSFGKVFDLSNKCNNQKKSLNIVHKMCSGRSYCVVPASNGVFGDPCFGTYKYLEVHFYCKKR
ncbi:L-rhamnose-binding lectin CSL3 [Hydra vulgaris]|uniref:L-rhamnose-binding lectin CSL3 n=1 Tax=Hydra vulgaris TaxID=6087 RepID=UPI001F5FCE4A|nr:L-rhamnose-binding lectin CSL3-like [Hydra vulgaris]